MDKRALQFCARYAAAPNTFGYCGPDKNTTLSHHLKDNHADSEVSHILSEFHTLHPYLRLIARSCHIQNPFDYRVVEAYWIGNAYCKPVTTLQYRAFLNEQLAAEKRLIKTDLQKLLTALDHYPFYPHHTYHVFNIFRTMAADSLFHSINALEECRIGWGTVWKKTMTNNSILLEIKTEKLALTPHGLTMTPPIVRTIRTDYADRTILQRLHPGATVSYHWGFLCDLLTPKQTQNLRTFTRGAIAFFNARL